MAKSNWTSLKVEVDEIDINKIKTFPADLSSLSIAIDNDVVKKAVFDILVTKVNTIDTSGFVLIAI